MQNIEETNAKYAIDANLFRLGSTIPKKNPGAEKNLSLIFFSISKRKKCDNFFIFPVIIIFALITAPIFDEVSR